MLYNIITIQWIKYNDKNNHCRKPQRRHRQVKFTTQNLGAVLAKQYQLKTLLIDLDPQGSLSQSCGAGNVADNSMAEVLGSDRVGKLTIKDILIQVSNHLLACSLRHCTIRDTEWGFIARLNREHVLERALKPIRDRFDVILIDTPPKQVTASI